MSDTSFGSKHILNTLLCVTFRLSRFIVYKERERKRRLFLILFIKYQATRNINCIQIKIAYLCISTFMWAKVAIISLFFMLYKYFFRREFVFFLFLFFIRSQKLLIITRNRCAIEMLSESSNIASCLARER